MKKLDLRLTILMSCAHRNALESRRNQLGDERGLLIDWLLLDNGISLIPCTIDKTPKMPCLQKKLDPANYQGKKHPLV